MQHRVTNNLVLRAGTSATPTLEWSKGIGVGQDNTAMFEVWLRSNSKTTVATLQATLQGSNNLDEWSTVTATVLTGFPSYAKVDTLGVMPWAYLRLKYSVYRTGATPNIMIAGTITTYKQSV